MRRLFDHCVDRQRASGRHDMKLFDIVRNAERRSDGVLRLAVAH